MKPFIDFYNLENILPVRQNIDDPRFFETRSFLYSRLGVPLRLLIGMEIIEFGPGGGFNAVATSKYNPSLYYFVEGSRVGVEKLKYFIDNKKICADNIEISTVDFLNFNIDKKFDLVIAEACIPGQLDPEKYLSHISSFVKKDGLIIITTTSKSSMLSEILRALYGFLIKDSFEDTNKYKQFLEIRFATHLSQLGTNTRSIEDWVSDNIINSFHKDKSNFSLLDAARELSNFEFQSSVPTFLFDLSWYKNYAFDHSKNIENLNYQLPLFESYLLDWRVKEENLLFLSAEMCQEISRLIEIVFDEVFMVLNKGSSEDKVVNVLIALDKLRNTLLPAFNETKNSITDFMAFLESNSRLDYKFKDFESWWGRGQQYISFRRIN